MDWYIPVGPLAGVGDQEKGGGTEVFAKFWFVHIEDQNLNLFDLSIEL